MVDVSEYISIYSRNANNIIVEVNQQTFYLEKNNNNNPILIVSDLV